MSQLADITAKNHNIHHLTISFHFLTFSSSHVLIVIINHPKTIAQTAITDKKTAILDTHDIIVALNPQPISNSHPSVFPCAKLSSHHKQLLRFSHIEVQS